MFHNTNTVLDFCMIALQGFHFDLPPLDEFKGKNKIVSLQLLAVTVLSNLIYTIDIKLSIFHLITPLGLRNGKSRNLSEIPRLYCGRQQKQNTSDLKKKSRGISDLFIGCKNLTKITHRFYKIQRTSRWGVNHRDAHVYLQLFGINIPFAMKKIDQLYFYLCFVFSKGKNAFYVSTRRLANASGQMGNFTPLGLRKIEFYG